MTPKANFSGTISSDNCFRKLIPQLPFKVSAIPTTRLKLDILLDETRLNTSLTDPLYPSYIAKALSTRLLPPANVLSSLSKILPELQSAQQVAQYALLRVLAQAIPSWRPSPTSVDDIALLWSLVRLVHRFTSEEAFAQDHIIFIETIEAWKYMLKAQSLRRLFKFEKEKNTGIHLKGS